MKVERASSVAPRSSDDVEESTADSFYEASGAKHGPCLHPWVDLVVNARGLAMCCPENRTHFGNIREKTPEELWNSEPAKKVRRLVAAGHYKEAGCDKECPFLRGRFKAPETSPPAAELINPDFDMPDDATPYAENVARVIDDYEARRETVTGLPLFVDMQPVLRCNADCIMCGQPHESPLVHNNSIREKLARLKPTANYFRWQGGEVFLDRSFRDALVADTKDEDNPHLRLYVITNGTLLNERTLRELATGPKPVFFLVSVDGATKETFDKVRVTLRYDRAMACIKTLGELERETGRKLVRWNYVVMKSTLDEMDMAMDKAVELGVDINFAPIQGSYPDENIFRYPKIVDQDLRALFERLERKAEGLPVQVSGFSGLLWRLDHTPAEASAEQVVVLRLQKTRAEPAA